MYFMIYNSNFSLNNTLKKIYLFFLLYPKRNQCMREEQEVLCFQARADTYAFNTRSAIGLTSGSHDRNLIKL